MLSHQKQADPPRKRATIATSEGMRKKVEAVRKWHPVIVTGVSFKERRLITPQNYNLLDVDPAYQRGETKEIPGIVAALQAGGTIPDTPDLAERVWGPPDGKLWVMDGQQRICALQQLNMSFYANVHISESLESERAFFLAMNARLALNSNIKVKAYNGPVASLLKALNERPDSGLGGRIEFDRGGGDRLSAAVMVKGIERLLSGDRGSLAIDKVLSRTDGLLVTNEDKFTATVFCRLVASVFERSYARTLPTLALAEIAREHWKAKGGRPALPAKGALKRLRAINWKTALPADSGSYQDYANAIVKKCWK